MSGQRDLSALLGHLPVGIYRTKPDGTILEANAALASILGYAGTEELLRVNAWDFYPRRRDRAALLATPMPDLGSYAEVSMLSRDGRSVWVRDYFRPEFDADGKVSYFDGALIDITELKEEEEARRQTERQYRRLFEKAHDALIVFEIEDERVLDVNDSACRLYGFDREEFLTLSMASISKDVSRGKEKIAAFLGGEERSFETSHLRKDGTELRLEINATEVIFSGKRAILSINRDISDRQKRLEELRRLALTDSLTGIANRLLFDDHLRLALAQSDHSDEAVALLYLDLDGFKEVNDSLGHGVGDTVLKIVAARLQRAVRQSDTVARLGGDEFAIILPFLKSSVDAEEIASIVLRELKMPIDLMAGRVAIGGSIGIALHPRDGLLPEQLLDAADRAMYRAKRGGKDRYCRAP